MTVPDKAILVNRLRLETALDSAGLAGLFVTSPVNVFYLSRAFLYDQHERVWARMPQVVVWPRNGSPALITSKSAAGQALRESWISDVRTYEWPAEPPTRLLADLLEERGLAAGKIGFESDVLPTAYYAELQRLLPHLELVGADDLIERVRAVKTRGEIEVLQRLARLTERAIEATFRTATPGVTERALANRMIGQLYEFGADEVKMPFLAFGANAATRRRPPGDDALQTGQTIRVDFGGWLQGLPSDISRMAVAGPASDRQRAIYECVRDTQIELFERMRPGVRVGDLYSYYRHRIEAAALPFAAGILMHSIGAQVHEYPVVLSDTDDAVLEEGMVMAVEPTVTLPGEAKYTIEDCVLVTRAGAQRLSDQMDTRSLFLV